MEREKAGERKAGPHVSPEATLLVRFCFGLCEHVQMRQQMLRGRRLHGRPFVTSYVLILSVNVANYKGHLWVISFCCAVRYLGIRYLGIRYLGIRYLGIRYLRIRYLGIRYLRIRYPRI
ncbi:hypothetical protein EYF80_001379 [Liparis tanakae]|uniref:Uncharacterized protein n=1 Tax=Liparis tanakae TaxID=230148 RepID=A0A4Z2JED2_9TELE|nr:hypothetical protein EYF80_001379 [Liparis tanakae]